MKRISIRVFILIALLFLPIILYFSLRIKARYDVVDSVINSPIEEERKSDPDKIFYGRIYFSREHLISFEFRTLETNGTADYYTYTWRLKPFGSISGGSVRGKPPESWWE